MLADSVAKWTLVGVLLTAVFTGLAAMTALLLYRQERLLFGLRRPIRIGKRKPVGVHRFPDEEEWDTFSDEISRLMRVLTLYIFNRSQVSQSITFDTEKSRVLWPFSSRHLHIQQREVRLSRQSGGNFRILMGSPMPMHSGWGELPSPWAEDWDRRYLVRLVGMTASGHRVRFLGFVRVTTFKPTRGQLGP
jgi:hypothetical protein